MGPSEEKCEPFSGPTFHGADLHDLENETMSAKRTLFVSAALMLACPIATQAKDKDDAAIINAISALTSTVNALVAHVSSVAANVSQLMNPPKPTLIATAPLSGEFVNCAVANLSDAPIMVSATVRRTIGPPAVTDTLHVLEHSVRVLAFDPSPSPGGYFFCEFRAADTSALRGTLRVSIGGVWSNSDAR
jgi:hypothetical protein